MARKKLTQLGLLMEYFKEHPNRDIHHNEIVPWATSEWKRRTGTDFKDTDRGIRTLYERGFLIKIGTKGIYRYDPNNVRQKKPENFSQSQKKQILERDGYKCVICGRGKNHGIELQVDHIKPKHLGGKATIENGQTLCGQHNYLKKTLKQTETGKKMFIRLYDLAKKEKDEQLKDFCADVLRTYEKHDINGHINWDK